MVNPTIPSGGGTDGVPAHMCRRGIQQLQGRRNDDYDDDNDDDDDDDIQVDNDGVDDGDDDHAVDDL